MQPILQSCIVFGGEISEATTWKALRQNCSACSYWPWASGLFSLAGKRQAQYPEGSFHTVFYNPEDPTEACLEPEIEGGGRMELYGGIVGIIIGALLAAGVIG